MICILRKAAEWRLIMAISRERASNTLQRTFFIIKLLVPEFLLQAQAQGRFRTAILCIRE